MNDRPAIKVDSVLSHNANQTTNCNRSRAFILYFLTLELSWKPITKRWLKKLPTGVLLWHSRLRIWHWHCSIPGCCCGPAPIPVLGSSTYCRQLLPPPPPPKKNPTAWKWCSTFWNTLGQKNVFLMFWVNSNKDTKICCSWSNVCREISSIKYIY